MTYYLIDIDNEMISVPQQVINKSNILKQYFEIYPTKGYKLEYPKQIIEQMIQLSDRKGTDKNDMLNELLQQLNIHIINPWDEEKDDESIVTELYTQGHARHIFNSIGFEVNKSYHTQYIESSTNAEYVYSIRDAATNIEIKGGVQENEFNKNYTIWDNGNSLCIKKDVKLENNNTNIHYAYRGQGPTTYRFIKQVIKPKLQITVDVYDIGSLVEKKLDVQINREIFDEVVSMLTKHLDSATQYNIIKINNYNPEAFCFHMAYQYVTKVRKNYNTYIVKIKRIHAQ
jgi:hypothetical protein